MTVMAHTSSNVFSRDCAEYHFRTPGGHRRFRESEVRSMLADLTSEATLPPARS